MSTPLNEKQYTALIFRQRPNAPLQVAFVAPSSEIDAWARVPTKRTGTVRNFQRAELPAHVHEVQEFFENVSNASPTAVVVGFDPIRSQDLVTVAYEEDCDSQTSGVDPTQLRVGTIRIRWHDDPDPRTKTELLTAILASYATLRDYIFSELLDITGTSIPGLEATLVALVEQAKSGQPLVIEETEDADMPPFNDLEEGDFDGVSPGDASDFDDTELSQDITGSLAGLSPSERQVIVGRLGFLAELDPTSLAARSEADLQNLYETVRDELKPGILIDGQHRIKGTRKLASIPFLVTALPDADWPELAFQFIVTNRTAKRVAESLLISIVGNSLSRDQRAAIEDRLRDAGVRVGLIEAVMRVNEDERSPFRGMLAFGLRDEKGFIDAAAIRGKVIQLWYERKSPIRELFDHRCSGTRMSDRTEFWKSENLWFEYFVAFWRAVAERYEGSSVFSTELEPGTRIPISRLMTATVLKVFQESVMEYVSKYVKQKKIADNVSFEDSLPDTEEFSALVKRVLRHLTPEFFTGWKLTGFDGSRGARDDLNNAIIRVISGDATVASLQTGRTAHRLFREETPRAS